MIAVEPTESPVLSGASPAAQDQVSAPASSAQRDMHIIDSIEQVSSEESWRPRVG